MKKLNELEPSNMAVYLFHQGTNFTAQSYFGAHFGEKDNLDGVFFRTWAPGARSIAVVGDFNSWNDNSNYMIRTSNKGVWECFISGVSQFDKYKLAITGQDGITRLKADPFAFHSETRPDTASKVYNLDGFEWSDDGWLENRQSRDPFSSPMNIYEVHMGSWKKHLDGNFYSYRDLAADLIPYVKSMGYTHIEMMPLSEHPYDGSWGYQVTGYFAATSRFGEPKDLMYFINQCHVNGIGVIMDWVPAHFPKDLAGLYEFDGNYLYEYSNPLKREHPDWGTLIFDYSRNEVRSFLISNALFWVEKYHVDGLRVDAVSSMLYLDFGKNYGEWQPNEFGGRKNLEAASFVQQLNTEILTRHPDVMMIAEESTSWPKVTKPVYDGGLGFSFKWNMGWMNDTLKYFSTDGIYKKYEHDKLTFQLMYAFSENYVLPFSHDEVVHEKHSLIEKQPGFYEEKFASLRTMMGYKMAHPGKKLSFMGNELAQFKEWDYNTEVDWGLLQHEYHWKYKDYIRDLNMLYLRYSQLWEVEESWNGFNWISCDDRDRNVISFRRMNKNGDDIVVACNFSPVTRDSYPLGVKEAGKYDVVLDSDAAKYGGNGVLWQSYFESEAKPHDGYDNSISITLPGLSIMFLELKKEQVAVDIT